jgi:hypothetical protein
VKELLWSGLRFVVDGLTTAAFFGGIVILTLFVACGAVLPVSAQEHWPTWAVVAVVLPVAVAALGFLLYQFFSERRRRAFFLSYARKAVWGWMMPVAAGIVAFFLSTTVFAVVTMLLQDAGLVQLSVPGCASCKPDVYDVIAFYIWDFLDAIPLLNVTESLHWDVPLTYSGALMGWLVLAFKVAVIIPLIQAVRTYLQVRKEAPRIHFRPWAWRRATRIGEAIHISWAGDPPPDGFVYDVDVASPAEDGGFLAETWLAATTEPSGTYTNLPRKGTYAFSVMCREQKLPASQLTSQPLKIVVREVVTRR